MSGFTKGPWVIIPSGDEWGRGRVGTIEPKPDTMLETNYWTVAECNNRRDECMANARLIAAAPDLLEALQMLLESNTQHSSIRVGDAIGCARKAIAKALTPQS